VRNAAAAVVVVAVVIAAAVEEAVGAIVVVAAAVEIETGTVARDRIVIRGFFIQAGVQTPPEL
jgi:hypothetical protein